MYNINQLQEAFERLYACSFKNYKTKCPFHQDKRASLSLSNNKKPFYKCFGCNSYGDIWDLYCKYHGVEFAESARLIKQDFGIDPPIEMKSKKSEISKSDMHIDKAKNFAYNKGLIYVTSYRYSNTNYKHRFKDKDENKTFVHTYFDSESNKIVFSEGKLSESDKNLVSRIYNKSNIEYAFSHNLDFYICEGEKDVDNISKLGFCACHIETGKEEELNKMLRNTTDYKRKIFHVYDKETSRVGIDKARKRAESINHDKQYLIEPKEKDISDDIDMYGKEDVMYDVRLQSNRIEILAFTDKDRAYTYHVNERTGKKTVVANIENIEKYLDITLEATLCVDCITKRSLTIRKNGKIKFNDDREVSDPYLEISKISSLLNNRLGVLQIRNIIDIIWNKRKINLFDTMLKKHKTNNRTEFDRLINDFYNSIDQEFTYKEEFKELFTFFFTRTLRRAIDYGRRKNQCLKMVFTIIGDQSCGKSRFVENIFDDMEMDTFVKPGASLGSLSKDDIIDVTCSPIVELAESTAVLKVAKCSEDLKRFISKSSDSYRAPYSRDNISHPRISSYIYTTNFQQILRDKTGNTRFYAIRAIKELPNPENYNMKDVWGYMYNIVTNISKDELKGYYQIPEILKKYIDRSSEELFDTSHYVDELENLDKEENEYRLYIKTELEEMLQVKDRKSKLDFHSSLESKGFKYKVHRMGINPKTGVNRTLTGYKIKTIKRFKNYGEPFYV